MANYNSFACSSGIYEAKMSRWHIQHLIQSDYFCFSWKTYSSLAY
jgi:hypothetical protein